MLTVHQLDVTIEAVTPLALDTYCGSALRGAFFNALWNRFCTNHEANACYECPLNSACPVSSLVAPLRDEAPRGQDVPRPYIITPSYHEKKQFQPEETYSFGFTLIGNSAKLYHYVMRAFQEMERNSLGHPLQELQGKRGRFRLREIYAVHPFTHERVLLWQAGETRPEKLQLGVSHDDIVARARQISPDSLTLDFQTPMRLVEQSHVLRHPSFEVLATRMAQRFEQMQLEYGTIDVGDPSYGREWYLSIKEHAKNVRLEKDETKWIDVQSYSSRQHREIPIGGFIGRASFTGPMEALRELLIWGELLRVGKNIVKGAGLYQIETTQQPVTDVI